MDALQSLLEVQIDFSQSHLFFPTLIHWLLVILLAIIALVHGVPYARGVAGGKRTLSFAPGGFDAFRLLGTILLTVIYILAMEWIGSFFPNRGYGFLLASMGYVLLLAFGYAHSINRRKFVIIVLTAAAAPAIAWFVLARLFRITLP